MQFLLVLDWSVEFCRSLMTTVIQRSLLQLGRKKWPMLYMWAGKFDLNYDSSTHALTRVPHAFKLFRHTQWTVFKTIKKHNLVRLYDSDSRNVRQWRLKCLKLTNITHHSSMSALAYIDKFWFSPISTSEYYFKALWIALAESSEFQYTNQPASMLVDDWS